MSLSNEFQTKYDENEVEAGVNPTGTIISFMGNNAPTGYLKCDGTEYNITDYPILADHFEREFGTKNNFGGDGETTFAVPDLRGEFLRGTGKSNYAYTNGGAAVGVHQQTSLIGHIFTDSPNITVIGNNNNASDWSGIINSGIRKYHGATTHNGEKRYNALRPTNTSVLYCIKY